MELTTAQKAYLPMTETAYYTLLALKEPRHGYGIMQHVEDITAGEVVMRALPGLVGAGPNGTA